MFPAYFAKEMTTAIDNVVEDIEKTQTPEHMLDKALSLTNFAVYPSSYTIKAGEKLVVVAGIKTISVTGVLTLLL